MGVGRAGGGRQASERLHPDRQVRMYIIPKAWQPCASTQGTNSSATASTASLPLAPFRSKNPLFSVRQSAEALHDAAREFRRKTGGLLRSMLLLLLGRRLPLGVKE